MKKVKKKRVAFTPKLVWIAISDNLWTPAYWGLTRGLSKARRESLRRQFKPGSPALAEPDDLRWIKVRITEITPKRKGKK